MKSKWFKVELLKSSFGILIIWLLIEILMTVFLSMNQLHTFETSSGCSVIKAAPPPPPNPHSLTQWCSLINHAEQEKNTC